MVSSETPPPSPPRPPAAFEALSEELRAVLTSAGVLVEVAGAWERVLGWSPADLHGSSLQSLTVDDDVSAVTAALAAVADDDAKGDLAPGSVHEFVARTRRRDGEPRWLRWRVMPNGGGRRYAVAVDDTARHAAELALRESEERWRLVQDEAPIGMAVVGLDGGWLAVNPALCDLVDYREEELLQLTFQDITHPDDMDADLGLLDRLLAGEIPSYRMEKRYIRRGGELVWILLAVSLVRDADGEPAHLIAQIENITGQKRQERKLEHAVSQLRTVNADLERFATMAAHDLTSPLATIGGMVGLVLQIEPTLGDQSRDLLRRAVGAVERAERVATGQLRFARAGAVALQVGTQDLGVVLDDVSALLSELLERHGARLAVGPIPPVEVDRIAIHTVLQNLVANAVRYADADRRPDIRVAGRRDGDMVEITVDDNGVGVPENQLDKVFEPFFRGGERRDGTGLGLATARRLAQRNGGTLHAQRREQGGTRMVLRLPAALA